jgi:transcription initiation factor TFIIIB Brf1 subunit/transcription initiation factor TFIIB
MIPNQHLRTVIDVTTEKTCIVCGKLLPAGTTGHVLTCEGNCREKHEKDKIDQGNNKIKTQKIAEVLDFLEKKFAIGIDAREFAEMISSIPIHNLMIDDFAMTSYYVMSTSNEKSSLTIDDLQKAAVEWDAINGSPRMIQHIKKMKARIASTEKAARSAKDDVQLRKLENKLKKYRRAVGKAPKIGFNNNAYVLVQASLKVAFCDVKEKVKSIARKIASDLGYDDDFLAKMDEKHEKMTIDPGKNPKIIAASLIYSTARDLGIATGTSEISSLTGVSKSSIEYVGDEN